MTPNERRAECGYRTLLVHRQYQGDKLNQMETELADLLSNMMHFCQESGYDFEGCLRIARDHYVAEIEL